ncbi:universal stress protein [Actinokineospora sp. HUAS TT18]|uniref:universal stress protein n=1 Tax=Actinokineospora sp. HUAS TT18 TaxID=3447451 RepID=UPI003F51AD92
MSTESTPSVVVGVDGSSVASAALSWAVEEAERRARAVRAVTVWPEHQDPDTADVIAAQIRAAADRHPAVTITHEEYTGSPGTVLVGAGAGADMLVVGSHGANRVIAALLGSVSAYCVRFAPCPVVIVPEAMAAPEPVKDSGVLTPGPLF